MKLRAVLVLLFVSGQAIAAGDISELQSFYERLRDLETRFEQTQYDETGKAMQVSLGHFSMSRPDRFRWEYMTPYTQTMVSDGKTFWFYDVDLAQVTKRRAADALQGTPALLLSGGPALQKQFTIESLPDQDGMRHFSLKPKTIESDFSAVELFLAKGVPQRMILRDNFGQMTTIEFIGVHLNTGLKPEQFAFKIPAGVEVVDGDAVPAQ